MNNKFWKIFLLTKKFFKKKNFFLCFLFIVYDLKLKKSKEEEIQTIIQYWIRTLRIKLGWINDFDKFIINYVTTIFMFDTFCSSSKLINKFTGHTNRINSIDYTIFDDNQFICSGSADETVCVWDIDNNKQIQIFRGHCYSVFCAKFSQYYNYNHHRNIICSSSNSKTIRFWDVKDSKELQLFHGHSNSVCDIEFSPFNCGKYLFSGSADNTIRLWDIETSKTLHVFNKHEGSILCMDISPLQNNNKKNNHIGIIGGNGYTICSGSYDRTIRIWDIEKTKQLIVLKKHKNEIRSVKYGFNELRNTILSGSYDKSVRLWDIRSRQQIQVFKKHSNYVNVVEYSPFVIKNNNNIINGNLNVICSGSEDNTIRFWDIRSNKNELHVIKGDEGIICLKFISLKKKRNKDEQKSNDDCDINLCYGSLGELNKTKFLSLNTDVKFNLKLFFIQSNRYILLIFLIVEI
ncbi:hypothetical protein RFI_01954 [Reticulomyxa filosa]|uniref:Uncharacterized protein n=1 Tax=Reticulomyxa filosa TaxID=46433 RepID=X6P9A9_RETFI|nr:hypothetical protein RFI_01954 [Reticulomyxa filosa]|eukprot:ETO35120.1 hypothetical protein RFI_01954 [Reticulomyxa filosa]